MREDWYYIFDGHPPTPTFRNVVPGGAGWYRFDGWQWRKWITQKNANYDGTAKFLTDEQLLEFAQDDSDE